MPDFLDSLITRARGGERALAPRTPSLFEPAPAGYGPGFGPRPPWAEAWADAIEAPVEERVVGAESDSSRAGRGAVAPPSRSATGGQADIASAAPTTASPGDGEPARGANQEREPGRAGRETRAVSRRDAPAPREPRPVPGAQAPQMPTPPAPSADAVARPGSRVRGRAEIAPGRRSASPPGDAGARAFPQEPGASEPHVTADSRSAEASRRPLARLGAELGALRRAEPLAADAGRAPSATVVIKTVDATARSPLSAGGAPPASASPRHIHVSIGQVEVRAAASPTAAAPRPRQGAGSSPTGLDEYLRRRNGGAA